ncbi:MAG: prepilin-type N-terminal cleavage/methylation domain-containing protein [Candidatus Wallbacteria bacterium]
MSKLNKKINYLSNANKKAFTVVEIMVAAAILAIILAALFKIFISGQKTFNASNWMANLNQEVSIGFRQMQEDLTHAAPLTSVVPDNYYKTADSNKNFDFYYNKKLLTANGAGPGDKIMNFKICKRPQKKGFETKHDNQPALIESVKYWLNEKKELCYEKSILEWDGEPKDVPNLNPPAGKVIIGEKAMIRDVESVKFIPMKPATEIKRDELFTIEIKVKPNVIDRKVESFTKSTQITVSAAPNTF